MRCHLSFVCDKELKKFEGFYFLIMHDVHHRWVDASLDIDGLSTTSRNSFHTFSLSYA